MPTLTGLHLAIATDVLTRVSLVLTAGLLMALTARRNAALRHAYLVAGLAAAFLVPAAMLTLRAMPVPRLQLGLLGRRGPDDLAAGAVIRSRPPNEPHLDAARLNEKVPPIVAVSGGGAWPGPWADASVPLDGRSTGPHAPNLWNARSMAGALLLVLVSGALVRATGLGVSLVRVRRIVARARPVAGDHVLSLLGLIQGRIPMRQPPRLLESAEVSAPVAAGVIGDYVLLPMGWAGRLGRDELLAVLCHEAAHLARRDHYVVILQELLASALWFHPLVHLFNRVLNRVREEVCDNYAIAMVKRPAYCDALLHIAVGRPGTPARGTTSMWPRHWSLEDRIRGILDDQRQPRTRISGVARSATSTFAVAICGLVAMPQLTTSQAHDRGATTAEADSRPNAGAGAVANEMTRRIVNSFPLSGAKMLRFENLAGRVELAPGKGPTVEVAAIVRVGDVAEAEVKRLIDKIRWVEAPAEDGESRWGLSFPAEDYPTVRYPVAGETRTDFDTVRHLDREVRISNRGGKSIPSVEFDLRVSLPPEVRVAVGNAVGPIEGSSVASPLELSTRHGVIKLDDVRAPIDATSEFGDVLISRLNADAVVRTGSGGIELSRIARGQVTLSARSGHCRIVQPPEAGFRLQFSGARPIDVIGGGVTRLSSQSDGRIMELLSRGTGGPSITVTSGTGETVIETGP
jgi:beta-lactamase regulating signal transducer with metallopeptidase domain